MIRQLKEENEKLKRELAERGPGAAGGNSAEAEARMKKMQEELEANMAAMNEMKRNYAD
jgi:hypothetical protein